MRIDAFVDLQVQVQKGDLLGLARIIRNSPLGDLWPRRGVAVGYGQVVYTEEGRVMGVRADEVDQRIVVGDKVWVNKLGRV